MSVGAFDSVSAENGLEKMLIVLLQWYDNKKVHRINLSRSNGGGSHA